MESFRLWLDESAKIDEWLVQSGQDRTAYLRASVRLLRLLLEGAEFETRVRLIAKLSACETADVDTLTIDDCEALIVAGVTAVGERRRIERHRVLDLFDCLTWPQNEIDNCTNTVSRLGALRRFLDECDWVKAVAQFRALTEFELQKLAEMLKGLLREIEREAELLATWFTEGDTLQSVLGDEYLRQLYRELCCFYALFGEYLSPDGQQRHGREELKGFCEAHGVRIEFPPILQSLLNYQHPHLVYERSRDHEIFYWTEFLLDQIIRKDEKSRLEDNSDGKIDRALIQARAVTEGRRDEIDDESRPIMDRLLALLSQTYLAQQRELRKNGDDSLLRELEKSFSEAMILLLEGKTDQGRDAIPQGAGELLRLLGPAVFWDPHGKFVSRDIETGLPRWDPPFSATLPNGDHIVVASEQDARRLIEAQAESREKNSSSATQRPRGPLQYADNSSRRTSVAGESEGRTGAASDDRAAAQAEKKARADNPRKKKGA